jgi:hypothetical protein
MSRAQRQLLIEIRELRRGLPLRAIDNGNVHLQRQQRIEQSEGLGAGLSIFPRGDEQAKGIGMSVASISSGGTSSSCTPIERLFEALQPRQTWIEQLRNNRSPSDPQ